MSSTGRRPLAVLDLETTGVDANEDRIVEVGIVHVAADGTEAHHVWHVNPLRPIPPEATAIHGIRDADVMDKPPFADLAREIHGVLSGCDLAGYNLLAFDLGLLEVEFARVGLDFPDPDARIVDAMVIFRKLMPHTLAGALKHYLDEEPHGDAHSALGDAVATQRVIRAQLAKHAELPRTMDGLDAFCRGGSVDLAGRFVRDEHGRTVFAFGKHKGLPVTDVDPGYLRWMLDGDFPPSSKRVVKEALEQAAAWEAGAG